MHSVEQTTWKLLSQLIVKIDPARAGVCVDAGVGNDDYYFEWFRNYGYTTIAIEPVPNAEVRRLCQERGVRLVEVALGSDSNQSTFYSTGALHTLVPAYWGGTKLFDHQQIIEVVGLGSIIDNSVTCLKLDIEGGEWGALKGLMTVRPEFHPQIIAFEFGGLYPKYIGQGGWTKEAVANTRKCLNLLRKQGYVSNVLIGEGSGGLVIKPFIDQRRLFSQDLIWGNIIVTRAVIEHDDWQRMAESELRFSL